MTRPQLKDPKVRRRRPILLALWSPALVASARQRAAHLHPGRPRIDWESQPDGFLEQKVTVRGAGCAECGRKIPPGTLALYGHSGDSGRTPHPRYLCLEKCTGLPRRELVAVPAVPAESPLNLAMTGRFRPDALTPEEIRAICEYALQVAQRGRTVA